MFGNLSSYLNKITQFFNSVENARKPCKRSLHEICDEDESPPIQPYQPLHKKIRSSVDEPMMPVRRANYFKPTLHLKSSNSPSLTPIKEDEPAEAKVRLTPIKEDEPAEAKERTFFKSKRHPYVSKASWQPTMTRKPIVRLVRHDDTPSTSEKLIQPKLTTLLEYHHQGTSNRPLSKMCEKSQVKKKTASWPRNILGRSNYSNVNKRCTPLASSKGKPNTIAESFRIEEKRQYQQLLDHCSLNQTQSPRSSSRSISRVSSTSSNSSSPFIYDVRWSKSSSSHSPKSESECENTSPIPISPTSIASKRVPTSLKLLSNGDKTINKKSSQNHKTPHHTSSRVQSPLSDITMKKKFRNSSTETNKQVISGSLFEEEDSLDEWIKHRYPRRKKCSPIPVIDLSLTDSDSLESTKDSDNESIEIVDEFSKGSKKNSLLEELLYRKRMEETQVSALESHDYLSTSGPSVDSMNRDENMELERMSPSQMLHNKVEVRLKRLGVLCGSPEKNRPVRTMKEPSFAPLTPEMQDQIDAVLIPYPKSEVLIKKFNISITRRDITTLNGLNWLNDEVINFYMNLIMERSNNKRLPKVYVFSTFFYPKLCNSGHESVSRWTKKVDIFTYDILLIPIHLDFHWCMAIVDFKKRCISYYDSMLGDNDVCLQTLLEYLEAEHMDKRNSLYITKAWKLESMKNIPEQMNGSDCGVFSCKFAEYKSRLASLDFKQDDMPYFRRQMVYEIINCKLLE